MGRQTTRLVSNQHCNPSPLSRSHLVARKEAGLGISSLLISRPPVRRLPQSLICAKGYVSAHRSMSRKLLKHQSAFPDCFFVACPVYSIRLSDCSRRSKSTPPAPWKSHYWIPDFLRNSDTRRLKDWMRVEIFRELECQAPFVSGSHMIRANPV